jgi:hypothetical protein
MNSKEPHAPIEARWSEEQMQTNWRGFRAALELWSIEKSYDPREQRSADGGPGTEGGAGAPVPAGGALAGRP